MAETRSVMRGQRPRELPRANRTYAGDRVCSHEGCATRISVYNKGSHCWAHAPLRFPLTRGERRKNRPKDKERAA